MESGFFCPLKTSEIYLRSWETRILLPCKSQNIYGNHCDLTDTGVSRCFVSHFLVYILVILLFLPMSCHILPIRMQTSWRHILWDTCFHDWCGRSYRGLSKLWCIAKKYDWSSMKFSSSPPLSFIFSLISGWVWHPKGEKAQRDRENKMLLCIYIMNSCKYEQKKGGFVCYKNT